METSRVSSWIVGGVGVAFVGAGAKLIGDGEMYYGLVLACGGLLLVLLGLAHSFEQRHAWRRRPRMPAALECNHFSASHDQRGLLPHPHSQALILSVLRVVEKPAIRLECSAPILDVSAAALPPPDDKERREARGLDAIRMQSYDASVDAISVFWPAVETLGVGDFISLTVFSDRPIRVQRVKLVGWPKKESVRFA